MAASVPGLACLQRYMGWLCLDNDLRLIQVEDVKDVFEMNNDLEAKKGDWQKLELERGFWFGVGY